jgi:putative DNA methylase
MTYKKKLIEVALPLEAINVASAREKSIRHGHPSTLHLWWARRPLAAARAVIFAQMVDDPSAHPDIFPTEKKQEKERQRLFRIIEKLVKWENTTNETVLQQAREEIWQSWRYTCAENADHPRAKELFDRYKLPAFHDPFAGGGALPLEAQRLGLESYASDLNPVAVLINKAMIEIPPKFAGKQPVNPEWQQKSHAGKMGREWKGAQGLAEDVRYYGQWMRDEAEKRIGHLYPKIEVTAEMAEERPDLKKYVGRKLTVIAWLWARTVKSPNPAFANVDVPLASTFMLSTKPGKEAYVDPVIEEGGYRFTVKVGKPKDVEGVKNGTKVGRGGHFRCIISESPIPVTYIRESGVLGTMGSRLMAIVAEGDRGRVYLSPTQSQEAIAVSAVPDWVPDMDINHNPRDIRTQLYGLMKYRDLFTFRQLVALTTFSDLVQEASECAKHDAFMAGLPDNSQALAEIGSCTTTYADAVAVYLAFANNKLADRGSTICGWDSSRDSLRNTFGRQAIPMVWDYAEANPFSDSSGSYDNAIDQAAKVITEYLPAKTGGLSCQADAACQSLSPGKVISTDPPYYDNIGYADLSDFFYVWLRRSLKSFFPDLFSTLAVPKAEELVATPYRHGSKAKAESFFLDGMTKAMHRLAEQAHPAFPVTIYYAFKQAESDGGDGTTNTGWDTFLAAVIEAGFAISGTWPMRTELSNRMIGSGTNALASSIILVCRKRSDNAPTTTRRDFVAALKGPSREEREQLLQEKQQKELSSARREEIRARLEDNLPAALVKLQSGNIAPVDLAQAAIGPGMAVYTRYAKVLDADGKPVPVRAALALINQVLDEALAEQEGDFDADTRWALTWFEQMGFNDGDYGIAEQLSKSKNTAVQGLVEAGIILSKAGKVRLLKPAELPVDWNPSTDARLTVWEMVHQLIRVLEVSGESAAADLVAKLGTEAEIARELCYRLYTLCERKKRANEAMSYNGLVQSWPEITRLAQEKPSAVASDTYNLFDQK